jgi:hypothetical protein
LTALHVVSGSMLGICKRGFALVTRLVAQNEGRCMKNIHSSIRRLSKRPASCPRCSINLQCRGIGELEVYSLLIQDGGALDSLAIPGYGSLRCICGSKPMRCVLWERPVDKATSSSTSQLRMLPSVECPSISVYEESEMIITFKRILHFR